MYQVIYVIYEEFGYKKYKEPVKTIDEAKELSTKLFNDSVIDGEQVSLVWTGFLEI